MPVDVKDVSPLTPPSPEGPKRGVDASLGPISLENYMLFFLVAPILCAYALMEWLRWDRPLPDPPWSATVVALLALVYLIYMVLTASLLRKSLCQGGADSTIRARDTNPKES